jgi:hypothetical protein
MSDCQHTVTQGREGETGSWCVACGIKVWAVDERECGDCLHHARLLNGSVCQRHLMVVVPSMHVTYCIADGTCWAPKGEAAEKGER